MFNAYREDYQKNNEELLKFPENSKNKKKEACLKKKEDLHKEAERYYLDMIKLEKEQLELQTRKLELFSGSLEEMANFEKMKYYAPKCIKIPKGESEDFLWKDDADMKNSAFAVTKIIGLFSLFLRGVDVSFFDDAPDE